MSSIAPNGRPTQESQKPGGRRAENNRIYANPLPILFSDTLEPGTTKSLLGLLGFSPTRVINPRCQGFFDITTRSVWITDAKDVMVLWQRGFFGKGNLSRSEPSWFARQANQRKVGSNHLTPEEMTARRRAERKQFKLDRAKAIAAAAAEAEVAFAEGRVVNVALSGPTIPSAATWKPSSPMTREEMLQSAEDDATEDTGLEDVEHLQLTLSEAFFLIWCLDCLSVIDPRTHESMSLSSIWLAFQRSHLTQVPTSQDSPTPPLHFDNPFLIHYVVYHHYRSLGWVVKSGIKFCVDYLLYKRGPVFSHAEFAIIVCPVYEDPADQESSSLNIQNASPFPWTWLSTINRVNSQVQKTIVLAYVTIPASARVPSHLLATPASLAHYSVREVVVRRFIPARMRD